MRPLLAFITLVSMTLASLSQAAIVYDRSPTTTELSTHGSPGIGFSENADNFTISGTGTVDIAGVVFWGEQITTGSFQVAIYSDILTNPAVPVLVPPGAQSISVSSMIVSDSGFDEFASLAPIYQYRADLPSPITLNLGQEYYFATKHNDSDWSWYSYIGSGTHYGLRSSGPNDGLWEGGLPDDLAFQLSDTSVVPEPGSIAVLSFAAVGLAFGAWRRRKKQKPATD